LVELVEWSHPLIELVEIPPLIELVEIVGRRSLDGLDQRRRFGCGRFR
jgi:hypothetical protein